MQDLTHFLDALFKGRLFRRRATLRSMLDLAPAQGEGSLVGYGLGIEQYALPGGHPTGRPPRRHGRLPLLRRPRAPLGVTLTLALNAQDDPTPLLIPALAALAATHR